MTTKTKDRIYYWATVLPLLAVIGLLNSHNKDQEAIIERTHKLNNKQLEAMAENYTELLNKQSIRQMIEIGKIEQHHRDEVAEVMEFYTTELEEARKDN